MAHLWRRGRGSWASASLELSAYNLLGQSDDLRLAVNALSEEAWDRIVPPSVLRSTEGPHEGTWLLLNPPEACVTVNGRTQRTGLLALRDRDEIRLADGERFFFSAQEVAVVEPFAGTSIQLRCPQCRRVIESGKPVVRCPAPGCGVVYHESDDLPCWTYFERCRLCSQSTELGTEARWTPEEL